MVEKARWMSRQGFACGGIGSRRNVGLLHAEDSCSAAHLECSFRPSTRDTTGAQELVGSSPTLLDWIQKTHSIDWSELDAGQKLASRIL